MFFFPRATTTNSKAALARSLARLFFPFVLSKKKKRSPFSSAFLHLSPTLSILPSASRTLLALLSPLAVTARRKNKGVEKSNSKRFLLARSLARSLTFPARGRNPLSTPLFSPFFRSRRRKDRVPQSQARRKRNKRAERDGKWTHRRSCSGSGSSSGSGGSLFSFVLLLRRDDGRLRD